MLISVITPAYNSLANLKVLYAHLRKFDYSCFNWIVIDSKSTDGTCEFFNSLRCEWIDFHSEMDTGIYDGINKGIEKCMSDFYVVVGSDDLPDLRVIVSTLLDLIGEKPDLILGKCYYGKNSLKVPQINFNNCQDSRMSFHSVGTIFRTAIHKDIGYYSTTLKLASDELVFRSIIKSNNKVITSDRVFGYYSNSGVSARQSFLALYEMFYVKLSYQKPSIFDVLIFALKLLWYRIRT